MDKIKSCFVASISICLILAMGTTVFEKTAVERTNIAIGYKIPANVHSMNSNKLLLREINYIKSTVSKSPTKGVRMAFIAPTFTTAAYDNAFYKFYTLYSKVPAGRNVTTNLNLLSAHITSINIQKAELPMIKIIKNLKYKIPNLHFGLYNDGDVDNGVLYSINQTHYDIVVIGHQEYVTQREYDNLKQFVAKGGKLIILDGNVFFAQVKYDRATQTVTLVKGHSWAYNGKSAWASVYERWEKDNSQWIGSNYSGCAQVCIAKFDNDMFDYKHSKGPHEEQELTNKHDIILLNYKAEPNLKKISRIGTIATYELKFHQGKVLVLGIFTDDIIDNGKFCQFFYNVILSRCTSV